MSRPQRAVPFWLGAGLVASVLVFVACEDRVELEQEFSSFEVRLTTPIGTPQKRCPLPGTPTVGFDLTGCPAYDVDSAERTVARVGIEARAIDNQGNFMESYNGIASVSVVPGKVEQRFSRLRFTNGIATGEVSFRAAFGDTTVWVTDDQPPSRAVDVPGLGVECAFDSENTCSALSLACVNTTPAVGFDAQGLAYCTLGCSADADCPEGYDCQTDIVTYADAAMDVSGGACTRIQPSYNVGTAGPIHLVEPTLADISRSNSLITSPFEDEFVEVARGHMIVTAVRIDGFYVTDTCPLSAAQGGAPAGADCSDMDRAIPAEFNHLFVFNFSRPDNLAAGDLLKSVAGPMTEFVGLTEMTFPLWEVDREAGPQPIPPAVNLHDRLVDHYPFLLERGERCFDPRFGPEEISLLDCPFALERLEGARTTLRVKATVPLTTSDIETLRQFGQWPVVLDTDIREDFRFNIITRENIPDFNPETIGVRTINAEVTGNIRQVAFDDRQEPIWIIEPRDARDCAWCRN